MLYLFCFIVGGGLLVLSVLGGHDHDLGGHEAGGTPLGEHEYEHSFAEQHAPELPAELPLPGAAPPPTQRRISQLASYFSLRTLVSFTAFFGLGGLAAAGLGLSGAQQLGFSLLSGGLVGAFAAVSLRLARTRGETSTGAGSLAGRTGVVLIAPSAQRPGKVSLRVEGQQVQLLARSTQPLSVGSRVIVIAALPGGVLDVRAWDGQ